MISYEIRVLTEHETQSEVITLEEQDWFETTRPKRMRPRPVLHETEAETKTNYCETEADTDTKKVVSRPRWSRDLNIPDRTSDCS